MRVRLYIVVFVCAPTFSLLLQSCVYGENRTSIQCTTPSLAKLALQPPVVTKVSFVLDGFSTPQWDLIYVEDPLFQDPKLTSKDNKSIVELKVRELETVNGGTSAFYAKPRYGSFKVLRSPYIVPSVVIARGRK